MEEINELTNEQLLRMVKKKDEKIVRQRQRIEALTLGIDERSYVKPDGRKVYLLQIRYRSNVSSQLHYSVSEIDRIISRALEDGPISVTQTVKVELERTYDDFCVTRTEYFGGGRESLFNSLGITRAIRKTAGRVRLALETSMTGGWVEARVHEHRLTLAEYKPEPEEEPVSSFIPLPKELSHSKKGLVNIRNQGDGRCFLWSHVRLLRDGYSLRIHKVA